MALRDVVFDSPALSMGDLWPQAFAEFLELLAQRRLAAMQADGRARHMALAGNRDKGLQQAGVDGAHGARAMSALCIGTQRGQANTVA